VTLMTFDKQSNTRRTAIESKSNHNSNHRINQSRQLLLKGRVRVSREWPQEISCRGSAQGQWTRTENRDSRMQTETKKRTLKSTSNTFYSCRKQIAQALRVERCRMLLRRSQVLHCFWVEAIRSFTTSSRYL